MDILSSVSHFKACGMYYPVFGKIPTKHPLLLIRVTREVAAAGFLSLSEWCLKICPLPRNSRCVDALLNKTFPLFPYLYSLG